MIRFGFVRAVRRFDKTKKLSLRKTSLKSEPRPSLSVGGPEFPQMLLESSLDLLAHSQEFDALPRFLGASSLLND